MTKVIETLRMLGCVVVASREVAGLARASWTLTVLVHEVSGLEIEVHGDDHLYVGGSPGIGLVATRTPKGLWSWIDGDAGLDRVLPKMVAARLALARVQIEGRSPKATQRAEQRARARGRDQRSERGSRGGRG